MKLFDEKGNLTPYGKELFSIHFDREVQLFLNHAENENDLRLIGSLIHKRVGDLVSENILNKSKNIF